MDVFTQCLCYHLKVDFVRLIEKTREREREVCIQQRMWFRNKTYCPIVVCSGWGEEKTKLGKWECILM